MNVHNTQTKGHTKDGVLQIVPNCLAHKFQSQQSQRVKEQVHEHLTKDRCQPGGMYEVMPKSAHLQGAQPIANNPIEWQGTGARIP